LADRFGYTRQIIIVMEQEEYALSLAFAFRIARMFRIPVEGVFEHVESGEGESYHGRLVTRR
jgi:putative transcriptional regulator